jgi:hypothetical protein
MAAVEVAEVEVAAARVGEQQRAVFARPKLVERLECDRLRECADFCVSDWFVRRGRDDRGVAA